MTIISGALNTSRPGIEDLVRERNEGEIKSIILEQIDMGAEYLDLNCGNRLENEKDDLLWLIEMAQKSCDLPLCLDSPDWQVLRDCSDSVKQKSKMILNSASAEQERMDAVFSLAEKYDCYAVALLMDGSGISDTLEGRISCMEVIDKAVKQHQIDPSRILIDPLVMPVSVSDQSGVTLFNLISKIKERYPSYRICGGIDNISFGLPMRNQIKESALTICLAKGLDTLIVVLDQETEQAVNINKLLWGEDPFSENFLNYYRDKIKEQADVQC